MNPSGHQQLSPPQREVLESSLLHSGFDCLLQMPTGSGKTWLSEQAIDAVLALGRRAVYLTPLRALARELTERWRGRFAPHPVGIFTGDYGSRGRPFPVPFREAHLLIMTPERLDACTRCWSSHWDWLPEVDLVVVDEFHLLGDGLRGARLEGTLSRVRRLNPFLRLLGLSATLGNREELADWLGAVDYASDWRPIPLEWRIVRYRQAGDKPALLQKVVEENVQTGGKSLVFVQSRRRAEEVCRLLQEGHFRAAHHHAGLGHEERRSAEEAFRRGETNVLVATSTLELGLNLPVRQVVLYDLQAFDGAEFSPLSCCSVWQRGGRAGRPGLDVRGEVVLLAAAWDRQVARYPEGRFEPIRSGLACRQALAEQVLAEVSTGLARTPTQLRRLFAGSLAARQHRLPDVEAVTREMIAAGMLSWSGAEGAAGPVRLKATRFGRVAIRHFLAPATVLLFRGVLAAPADWSFFDLLLTAAASEDCEPILPVDYEELEALADRLSRERSLLLRSSRQETAELLGIDGKRLLASFKTALAAREWTRLGDAETVAKALSCYPFEVRRLQESMERLLTGMAAAQEPLQAEPVPAPSDEVGVRERLRVLQRMVAAGLDEEVVTLTLVPGIGPRMARRLHAAGVGDIEALAQSTSAELAGVRGLSARRAGRWMETASRLVPTCSAFRYREHGPVTVVRRPDWPAEVDPYRVRRALDLKVRKGSDSFEVTGGLEPHIVRFHGESFECDCPDRAAGNLCKHILAVRLSRGEEGLRQLVQRVGSRSEEWGIDLFALWVS